MPRFAEKAFGCIAPFGARTELVLSGQIFCDGAVKRITTLRGEQRRFLREHLLSAIRRGAQIELVQEFLKEVISQSHPAQEFFGYHFV